MIQVAGIVTSGATAWEDGGQEYHVLWPPPNLMKSFRCAAAAGAETKGQKTQVDNLGHKINTERGGFLKRQFFVCAPATAICCRHSLRVLSCNAYTNLLSTPLCIYVSPLTVCQTDETICPQSSLVDVCTNIHRYLLLDARTAYRSVTFFSTSTLS